MTVLNDIPEEWKSLCDVSDYIAGHSINDDSAKVEHQMEILRNQVLKECPKKVIQHFGGYVYCPNCRKDYSSLEDPIDYCWECGQHLLWDD